MTNQPARPAEERRRQRRLRRWDRVALLAPVAALLIIAGMLVNVNPG